MTDELVWAMVRERSEEARRVRPHTEARIAEKSRLPQTGQEPALHLGLGRETSGTLGA